MSTRTIPWNRRRKRKPQVWKQSVCALCKRPSSCIFYEQRGPLVVNVCPRCHDNPIHQPRFGDTPEQFR